MTTKTRNKTASHMSVYLGAGKELPPSQLPTLRDLLRYGLYLKEVSNKDRRNYTTDNLITDIMPALLAQWGKANAQLVHPVLIAERTIHLKLKACWENAFKLSTGQGKLKDKEKLSLQLDKLFDILRCHCPINLCVEIGCSLTCKQEAHITCNCKREEKIPVLELRFIRSQRDKEGSNSSHMIGGQDKPESKKQEKAIKNKEKKQQNAEMKARP